MGSRRVDSIVDDLTRLVHRRTRMSSREVELRSAGSRKVKRERHTGGNPLDGVVDEVGRGARCRGPSVGLDGGSTGCIT